MLLTEEEEATHDSQESMGIERAPDPNRAQEWLSLGMMVLLPKPEVSVSGFDGVHFRATADTFSDMKAEK